jgi:hypothetical protein
MQEDPTTVVPMKLVIQKSVDSEKDEESLSEDVNENNNQASSVNLQQQQQVTPSPSPCASPPPQPPAIDLTKFPRAKTVILEKVRRVMSS